MKLYYALLENNHIKYSFLLSFIILSGTVIVKGEDAKVIIYYN